MSRGVADRVQLHASCVALEGVAILLRGAPGVGKSDLALRLVDAGGALVADDLCEIRREGARLLADLPASVEARFRGRIEIRGLGVFALPYAGATPLALVVDLRPGGCAERLPLAETASFLGVALPLVCLDPFHASCVAKLRLLAKGGPGSIMRA
ncbi:MAG TPA: HPr kinase/phosphatase C-terminal domain-containing protein, partial [Dongiaceae bacterium]|nr:HPr kinase/phosphatase C-terminal domain-containing protein [Dongiaceae bacterium]